MVCKHCGKPCGRLWYCSNECHIYANVNTIDPDKCWEWQRSCKVKKNKTLPYGLTTIRKNGNLRWGLATHLSYTTFIGEFSAPMLLHSCNNTICVNPYHLRPGTALENRADQLATGKPSGMPVGASYGEKNPNAKLTWQDVEEIRSSNLSLAALGKRFGVHLEHIRLIRKNKSWKVPQGY